MPRSSAAKLVDRGESHGTPRPGRGFCPSTTESDRPLQGGSQARRKICTPAAAVRRFAPRHRRRPPVEPDRRPRPAGAASGPAPSPNAGRPTRASPPGSGGAWGPSSGRSVTSWSWAWSSGGRRPPTGPDGCWSSAGARRVWPTAEPHARPAQRKRSVIVKEDPRRETLEIPILERSREEQGGDPLAEGMAAGIINRSPVTVDQNPH